MARDEIIPLDQALTVNSRIKLPVSAESQQLQPRQPFQQSRKTHGVSFICASAGTTWSYITGFMRLAVAPDSRNFFGAVGYLEPGSRIVQVRVNYALNTGSGANVINAALSKEGSTLFSAGLVNTAGVLTTTAFPQNPNYTVQVDDVLVFEVGLTLVAGASLDDAKVGWMAIDYLPPILGG